MGNFYFRAFAKSIKTHWLRSASQNKSMKTTGWAAQRLSARNMQRGRKRPRQLPNLVTLNRGKRLSALTLDLTPPGNIAVVLFQRPGKGVTTRTVRDKEDVVRILGVQRCLDGSPARIGDRRRRQPVHLIGVIRRAPPQLRAANTAIKNPFAASDA